MPIPQGILCRLRTRPTFALLTQSYPVRLTATLWQLSEYMGPRRIGARGAGCDGCAAELEEEACDPV